MLGVGRFIRESHFLQSIFIKIDLNLSGRHKILSLGFMEAIWIYSWIVSFQKSKRQLLCHFLNVKHVFGTPWHHMRYLKVYTLFMKSKNIKLELEQELDIRLN